MFGLTLKDVAKYLFRYIVIILIGYACILYPMYTAIAFFGYIGFSILFVLFSTTKDEESPWKF